MVCMKKMDKIYTVLIVLLVVTVIASFIAWIDTAIPVNIGTEKTALTQENDYMEQTDHNKTEVLTKGNIKADINWNKQEKPYGEVKIGDIGKTYTYNGEKTIEIPLKIRIDHQAKAGTIKLGFARFTPYGGKWRAYEKNGEELRGKVATSRNIVPENEGVKAEIFEEKSNLPLSTVTKFENKKIETILKITVPEKNKYYEKLGENTTLYRSKTDSPNFLRQLQIVFEPTYMVENGETQGVQELRE